MARKNGRNNYERWITKLKQTDFWNSTCNKTNFKWQIFHYGNFAVDFCAHIDISKKITLFTQAWHIRLKETNIWNSTLKSILKSGNH